MILKCFIKAEANKKEGRKQFEIRPPNIKRNFIIISDVVVPKREPPKKPKKKEQK
jgi:hypothetical protein